MVELLSEWSGEAQSNGFALLIYYYRVRSLNRRLTADQIDRINAILSESNSAPPATEKETDFKAAWSKIAVGLPKPPADVPAEPPPVPEAKIQWRKFL